MKTFVVFICLFSNRRPASLDELLKFLRIMHLTATHELTPPPASTETATPTVAAPYSLHSTSSFKPSSSSPPSSTRPVLRSPLEHCVAHLLAASTAPPLPLSLPNELAALRRARQLADELLRAYATDARADAERLFEDRLGALLSAAMADAEAEAEAQGKRLIRSDREARDESRVENTVTGNVDADANAESKLSTRTWPPPAAKKSTDNESAQHHERQSHQQQHQRHLLLSTALDAARSARDRLRPLDATMRAAIAVRLEEKLALEALRRRVRARWMRILDTGVLHAGGAEESVADDGDGQQDDGGDEDAIGEAIGEAAAAAAAAAAASTRGGAQSADGDASIPVSPAGFDWCARTLAG
jgi:hypothetical protein